MGIASGVYLALQAYSFGPLTTSLFATSFGSLYIAVIGLHITPLISAILIVALPR